MDKKCEILAVKKLCFTYPGGTVPAVDHVDLTISRGEFVTLCGPSGCGKTTLLRHLKGVFAPHGQREGEIFLDGIPLEQLDLRSQSEKIGFVLQSPEQQIVTDKVWHELAFGLESLGYDAQTIRLRVAEMAGFFGISAWFHKDVSHLSGGQKQLLNLAAVMAMGPELLILDEPTSQLDPIAAADFLAAVARLNRELGVTVLLTEHRLEEALPHSDRLIVMDSGRVVAEGTPSEAGQMLKARGHKMFTAMPAPIRIYGGVDSTLPCPVTVREGKDWLEAYAAEHPVEPVPAREDTTPAAPAILEARQAWFRYEQDGEDVVRGLDLSVPEGSFFALVGGNGTGKTTAMNLLAGIRHPQRGEVRLDGRNIRDISGKEKFDGLIGVLPQNPQTIFVKKTVEEDLWEMLEGRDISPEEAEKRMEETIRLCELGGLLGRHPFDLSGGEQQRAALAKVLLLRPRLLLLDEPTKGLDGHFKAKLAQLLLRLRENGTTIFMVSHDVEFCARYPDRCALFFDGAVVSQGTPQNFFAGNSFYTTAANRMARHRLPLAVTAEDVILACGGKVEEPDLAPEEFEPPWKQAQTEKMPESPREKKKEPSRRSVLAALAVLLLMPLTLIVGSACFGERKYAILSVLMVLEAMVPFFLIFEGRKPQARELVLIATLCAVAVAGRAAFFFLPQFKPMAALVILSGVAFGGETGFLVGAVSMLCSNMFFGQGPWTPFQMFAMGLIGFLAGVFFQRSRLGRSRVVLCLYGTAAVLLLYAPIMNTYTVFQTQAVITLPALMTAVAVALPMDIVHALSAVLFLWLGGPAFLDKLDRVKAKYGLLE